jgi:hypothetical protein
MKRMCRCQIVVVLYSFSFIDFHTCSFAQLDCLSLIKFGDNKNPNPLSMPFPPPFISGYHQTPRDLSAWVFSGRQVARDIQEGVYLGILIE